MSSIRKSLSAGQAIHPFDAHAAHAREVVLPSQAEHACDLPAGTPPEGIEPDQRYGDPGLHVRSGDVVLDLGVRDGKTSFIVSQLAGPTGRVIGIECSEELLALARNRSSEVAERPGFENIEFRRGLVHDLGLDLDLLAAELKRRPVQDADGWLELRDLEDRLRRERPLVVSDSIDCVLLAGVPRHVRLEDRTQLLSEIFRVLKRGGRAVISDIVSDETVPDAVRREAGVSGACREDEFLQAFEQAGFHGIELIHRERGARQVVAGIEFRSVTVRAYKGKQGPCFERRQALLYRGPFRQVEDDDGHVYRRGERVAVCDKTFRLLQSEPYTGQFEAIEPASPVPLEQAPPFDCRHDRVRHPQETKGGASLPVLDVIGECCTPGDGCC